jgi:hypothetical protein
MTLLEILRADGEHTESLLEVWRRKGRAAARPVFDQQVRFNALLQD